MRSFLPFLLLASLTFTLVFSFTVTPSNDDKVLIELYYQSLCPDCQKFIQGSLKRASTTADLWKISEFKLYPYGNAKTFTNGSSWSFTCQHGVRECEGNMIEACAIQHAKDYYTQALPFVICLQSNTSNWNATGQRCASTYSLDWSAISTCAYGPQGIQLHYQYGQATNNLVPKHTYVPWIVVNGVHTTANENAVISNMVSFICRTYKGSIKIAACH